VARRKAGEADRGALRNPDERTVPFVAIEMVGRPPDRFEQIEIAVVVVVRPGGAERRVAVVDDVAGRDPGERPVAVVPVETVLEPLCRDDVGDEQIEIAVVVVVAPARAVGDAAVVDQLSFGDLLEAPVAPVSVEEIVLADARDEKVGIAVVVVVGPDRCPVDGDVVDDVAPPDAREAAVTVVAVEEVRLARVGDKEVEVAVPVVVGPRTGVGVAVVADNVAFGDLGERAVAVVAEQAVVLLLLVGDEKIEVAVAVVIAPGAAGRVVPLGRDRAVLDRGERAVAVVAVEKVLLPVPVGDEEIEMAVAVVVGERGAGRDSTVVVDAGADPGEGLGVEKSGAGRDQASRRQRESGDSNRLRKREH
jgi:hypothetical protein